jgi:hypothetical protein
MGLVFGVLVAWSDRHRRYQVKMDSLVLSFPSGFAICVQYVSYAQSYL